MHREQGHEKGGLGGLPREAVRPRKVMEKDIDYVRLGKFLGYAGRMWQEGLLMTTAGRM